MLKQVKKEWEEWILFILKGVEQTSADTITLVKKISELMAKYKILLRTEFGRLYSHEMLNNLFRHPYTKIEFFPNDLTVSHQTASKHLDTIVSLGLLEKMKVGKENYYINTALFELFLNQGGTQG